MLAHATDSWAVRFGPPTFKEREDGILHCSYCGSLTIEDTLRFLQTPGTQYSGSDWKYGWPHKFYITYPSKPYIHKVSSTYVNGVETDVRFKEMNTRHGKFYSTHLADATQDQIRQWNKVALPLLGVAFDLHDDAGVCYYAPRGFQTWGVVGAEKPAEGILGHFGPKPPESVIETIIAADYRIPPQEESGR